MNRFLRLSVILLAAVFIAAPTGCSHNNGRLGLAGTVAIDGRPVELGTISFQPAKGSEGTGAGAGIDKGAFEIPPLPA